MQTPLFQESTSRADPALRAMFEARKRVFVDLLKWDVPVLAGKYELDQFDTPDATYLILCDDPAGHRASARPLPTDSEHILGDLYGSLCDGPLPTGPHVREITRFCLEPSLGAAERRHVRNQLVTALVEYALQTGITDYTGVADRAWFEQIMVFGWACSPLGAGRRIDGAELVGLHIQIDADTPAALRRAGIYSLPTCRLAASGGLQ